MGAICSVQIGAVGARRLLGEFRTKVVVLACRGQPNLHLMLGAGELFSEVGTVDTRREGLDVAHTLKLRLRRGENRSKSQFLCCLDLF